MRHERIVPGQRWRHVAPGGGVGPQVLTVDEYDGRTVQGTVTQEGAPGVTSVGVYGARDVLDRMTLIQDPEWPTHRVVMTTIYTDPAISQAMHPLGLLAGRRSVTLSRGGKPTAWWDIVAPTEGEALAWARAAVEPHAPMAVDLDSIHVDNSIAEHD